MNTETSKDTNINTAPIVEETLDTIVIQPAIGTKPEAKKELVLPTVTTVAGSVKPKKGRRPLTGSTEFLLGLKPYYGDDTKEWSSFVVDTKAEYRSWYTRATKLGLKLAVESQDGKFKLFIKGEKPTV